MKIKSDFVMREIAGEKIVVPTGDAAQMNALITLNGVADFIWECLQEDRTAEEVKEMVLLNYEVDQETAGCDVDGFLEALRQCDMLEE